MEQFLCKSILFPASCCNMKNTSYFTGGRGLPGQEEKIKILRGFKNSWQNRFLPRAFPKREKHKMEGRRKKNLNRAKQNLEM